MEQTLSNPSENKIISDIRALIEHTRSQVAATVNAGMTLMYWHIGERINRDVLHGERAAYEKLLERKLQQAVEIAKEKLLHARLSNSDVCRQP